MADLALAPERGSVVQVALHVRAGLVLCLGAGARGHPAIPVVAEPAAGRLAPKPAFSGFARAAAALSA
jgi:hypothetical protein